MQYNLVIQFPRYRRTFTNGIVQSGLDIDGYEAASIDVILHVNVQVLVRIKLYD